jgi:signal transduction histidine kinase
VTVLPPPTGRPALVTPPAGDRAGPPLGGSARWTVGLGERSCPDRGGQPERVLRGSGGAWAFGENGRVREVWNRGRSLLVVGGLLAGALAPARYQPLAHQVPLYALAAVVLLGWIGWLGWLPAPVGGTDIGLVVCGVAGTVLALLLPDGPALGVPAIVAVRAGASWQPRPAAGLVAALSIGCIAGRAPVLDGRSPWWLLFAPALLTGCLIAGWARAQNARLAAQAERERARAAALDERARIAREIHDILAHALSALSVQLETADALLDGGRTGQAQESVRRAGQLAREGLAETRRAIGALRGDSVPLPELLDALVAGYRSNVDSAVAVRITGVPRPLEPDAALALYRTAQEALTNAHKHAPGAPVELTLAFGDAQVALSVVNGARLGAVGPLAAAGGGYGLAGLRERAELAGGSLTAGPVGDGYQVGVTIPA